MRFIRNTVKEKNTAKLLFRDTDSLVYTSKTDDVYEIFIKIKICLILVIIHDIRDFLILLIKKQLVK